MNGINGVGMTGGMVVAPMPAGHQADLNYIYGLVDELSRQLNENRRILEDVVSSVGKIRSRARQMNMSNDDLIAAADDLNTANLDLLISVLSESLEKAKYSRDENFKLLSQYASSMAAMLQQFHEYKAKHVADVSAWHRSYRQQLAEEREENRRLREQIWDMQAHAGKANAMLRDFRARFDADPQRWDARVSNVRQRQELRFWKRMAMPELADDSDYWSDDDDLIDVNEKSRQRDIAREQTAAAALASQQLQEQEESDQQLQQQQQLQQRQQYQEQQRQQQQHLQQKSHQTQHHPLQQLPQEQPIPPKQHTPSHVDNGNQRVPSSNWNDWDRLITLDNDIAAAAAGEAADSSSIVGEGNDGPGDEDDDIGQVAVLDGKLKQLRLGTGGAFIVLQNESHPPAESLDMSHVEEPESEARQWQDIDLSDRRPSDQLKEQEKQHGDDGASSGAEGPVPGGPS